MILATRAEAVVTACLFHHRSRDVYSVGFFKMFAQRLGQSPNSAAEIKRLALAEREIQSVDVRNDGGDFPLSQGEELVHVPFSVLAFFIRQDSPQRITFAKLVPILFHFLQVGVNARGS